MSERERGRYEQLGAQIGVLVDEKQAAYGDSMGSAPRMLRELWPAGVSVESYADLLAVVRILDKLKRIATHKDAFWASPYRDVAGYALLMAETEEEGHGGK